ncbi:hypothetical protein D3C83_119800 [compost metagenome]
MIAVLENEVLARRLGEAGRATAERHYSWDVIGRGLIDTYLNVIHGNSRGATFGAAGAGSAR